MNHHNDIDKYDSFCIIIIIASIFTITIFITLSVSSQPSSQSLQDALLMEAVSTYGNDWVKVRTAMGEGATSDR